ncbi:hypothetical protein FIV34_02255 [Luteibacter pinisoli]|uniref:Uncharacterized protein n=1 Tax=Luteibacter pinisoli TaxID=2589080 RepID=A0A4Y5YYT7_9GAMM|nr:hypothetical protein [Luteibacter pinisoli]QDE38101.1 hypothetical protein FIV34_02255 [Luteibacter pinisoli]
MSILRTALVLAACLTVEPVAAGSVLGRLRTAYAAQVQGTAAPTSEDYVAQLLADPTSPYSATIATPRFTNEVYWADVIGDEGGSESDVLARLQAELGLARARPGIDITPAPGFRDPFVSAHATKAGLDADIFWRMLDIHGHANAVRFASSTLGLQLLREQALATVPASRAALGVDVGVFQRVMRARHADEISDYDLRYLDTLVQHRLLHPLRETGLPTAWRIARIAAAFRDAQGYVGGPPCRSDATPDPRFAGTLAPGDERTPCLVAAHDRAVHRWYVDVLRQPPPAMQPHGGTLARIGALVAAVLPLVDMFAIAEVVEAAVADDLVSAEAASRAEAEAASERAARLTCGMPT